MNPELKEKWIEALRSGKYPQSRGALRDECGFCCLGVLCDVVDPHGWYDIDPPVIKFRHRLASAGILRLQARKDFQLGEGEAITLIDMNDTHKNSFAEIADYIEQNL